jgi:hypothetical protein
MRSVDALVCPLLGTRHRYATSGRFCLVASQLETTGIPHWTLCIPTITTSLLARYFLAISVAMEKEDEAEAATPATRWRRNCKPRCGCGRPCNNKSNAARIITSKKVGHLTSTRAGMDSSMRGCLKQCRNDSTTAGFRRPCPTRSVTR